MSKFFPLKRDGFSQRIYCADGAVFVTIPYCDDRQEMEWRARLIMSLPKLLSGTQMLLDVLDELYGECEAVGEFQAPIRMARASLAEALGTAATNPEAAAAFDKMMGSPKFPSIKGSQP